MYGRGDFSREDWNNDRIPSAILCGVDLLTLLFLGEEHLGVQVGNEVN